MNDPASATSSASTKLFHGGLRYLEYFEFRLVREALIEREILLKAMPHISWPMRFVPPYHKDMRLQSDPPTSKLLNLFMPWMKGQRPAWLIRFGLFMYDHFGGRKILCGTTTRDLSGSTEGAPLQDRVAKAFEYSDCWGEDYRLVVLNARDAEAGGAQFMTRKLYRHDKCYFFQGTDGRIIFAIPYETDFTLIGTTDAEHPTPSLKPRCTP
jgi:glycerol-3-phosphate dehydrogenase